jgi:CheY-like chemotaxis protein
MRILIAEDEQDIATVYKNALENRGHEVIITENGERCMRVFREYLNHVKKKNYISPSPFDAVILDYKMPKKNGLETAKEILKLNAKQRIIFASAYVMDTLKDAIKELKQTVELIQKPFHVQDLIDIVEDIEIYDRVRGLMSIVRKIKDPDNPSEEEIMDLFKAASKAHKGGFV